MTSRVLIDSVSTRTGAVLPSVEQLHVVAVGLEPTNLPVMSGVLYQLSYATF